MAAKAGDAVLLCGVLASALFAATTLGRASTIERPLVVPTRVYPTHALRTVEIELRRVMAAVDVRLRVKPVPLRVRLYPTPAAFRSGLWKLERLRPQGSWDTMGNVVKGILPLEAELSVSRHRLAHVYAEWVFDHLTSNRKDREPDPAWLYDGLAEVVAQRVAPAGTCELRGFLPYPLRLLAKPSTWQRIRGHGEPGIEYCEARLAAKSIARRAGWNSIVDLLHESRSWADFARKLTLAEPRLGTG